MPVFTIRAAQQDDIPGMARVHVETWRAAYAGILPADFLAGLSVQTAVENWRKAFAGLKTPDEAVFVAETETGEIAGIAMCGPLRDPDPVYQGEIYLLYVLPKHQNQGVGRRLFAACARHLAQRLNLQTMLVWVMAENPYRKFNESLGGKPAREKTVEVGGKTITDVGYGWEAIDRLATLMRS
jgi:ribosomal protein S18 acetylase RimI-like enzyme